MQNFAVYKETPIISGTGAVIWPKTNLEPTDHHHPRSSLPCVCIVPSVSAIFKCIQEVMFCEGVQRHLRFCLDHLSGVKMAAFQFYLHSKKQKSKVDGERVMLFLVPWWKWKCETVHYRDSPASSFVAKVLGEVFARVHACTVKRYNSMRNWLFCLLGWLLWEYWPWCGRKIMSMLLALLFIRLALFGLGEFGLSVYRLCFLPRTVV
jgi:hypothetical protein